MSLLIYGANGYTGQLIARMAASRSDGPRPILAGRNGPAVAQLAASLGLPHRAFDLADTAALDAGLKGVQVVLHCAGPFSRTAEPMVSACLRARAHYLDITGEIEVFERCAGRDTEARAAQAMIMPGVGFDVVPSDCLAAHLKRRLPDATHLALAFQGQTQASRGTATTMIENIPRGGLVREDGQLRRVPAGHRTRVIDMGLGPTPAITIPWGDVATAYRTTGIPNIEVYIAAPGLMRLGARLVRWLGPVLGSAPVQRLLLSRVRAAAPGPSDEDRARRRTYLWGEARAGDRKVVSRLQCPEGYTLTVLASLEIAGRVLRGDFKPGYQTPASAYGPDLILSLPGCTRIDEA
jgi:short subunit dehydrogenase-like uncharacterized protein